MANRPFVIPMSTPPPRGADEPGANKPDPDSVGGLRPKLFYDRYGILENPFGVTPNPRYLYQSDSHAKARAALITGIECGLGFQALIAPPGMGKTTILFDLLQRFDKVARTAFLFHNHRTFRDFSRCLISELGGEVHDSDPVGMQDTIVQLLIREHRAGRQTIIIIDEAQNLNASVLETVRLLSNFETSTEKLVQIVLAGQPKLAQRLKSPELAQLQQRISMLMTLVPFDLEDTTNYIEHRLIVAGYKGPPLFPSAAVRLIWELSGGVPRKINTLCFNALLLAGSAEQKQVHPAILKEVVADLDLDRIQINVGTPPGGTRDGRTTNGLSLGNTAEDPLATSIDNTCEAAVSSTTAEADVASTRPIALDEVDLAQLKTIAAEMASISPGEKARQAAVSSAKTEADVPSTRPTALDEVDLAQLKAIAAEMASISSGEKARQAAVSSAKTEADVASTRPTDFYRIDLVQLGKTEPKTDSTSEGKDVVQAAVSPVGPASDDIVVRVFPQNKPSSAGQHKTDFAIFADTMAGAPSRETAAIANSTDVVQATLEAPVVKAEPGSEARRDLSSGVESRLTSSGQVDYARGIKPDPKIEIQPESKLRNEFIPKAEPGVTAGIARRETAASGRSTDILQATLEALAAEAKPVPKTRLDLSSGVESKLTCTGIVGLAAGTKPDPKTEIKPDWRLGIELTPKAEPGVTAGVSRRGKEASGNSTNVLQATLEALAAELRARHDLSSGVESKVKSKDQADYAAGIKPNPKVEIKSESGLEGGPGVAVVAPGDILRENDTVFETIQQSLGKTVAKPSSWLKQRLATHKTTIYLGTSILIFLLGLSYSTWLPQSPPEPTLFRGLLSTLGMAAPPHTPTEHDDPEVGVWVDRRTGLYYCRGAESFGKTRQGTLMTQRQARQEHFKKANRDVCQ